MDKVWRFLVEWWLPGFIAVAGFGTLTWGFANPDIGGDALPVAGSIFVAGLVWFLTERSRSRTALYRRKEHRYRAILTSLGPAFFVGQSEGEERQRARQQFLLDMQLAWLYCPDEVISVGNEFLRAMSTDAAAEERAALDTSGRAFLMSLRRDLIHTTLGPSDFFIGSAAR